MTRNRGEMGTKTRHFARNTPQTGPVLAVNGLFRLVFDKCFTVGSLLSTGGEKPAQSGLYLCPVAC